MYKTMILVAAVAAMLAVPTTSAIPNAQTGTQSGTYWSETTEVVVQGGTGFELKGVWGDHDIRFYDADGRFLGAGYAFGDEVGTVPAGAVTGHVLLWSMCYNAPDPALCPGGDSTFVYIDGL